MFVDPLYAKDHVNEGYKMNKPIELKGLVN